MKEHIQDILVGGRPMKKWEIEMQEKDNEIERLNNIIKDVREYIERYLNLNLDAFDTRNLLEKELEILDKVGSEAMPLEELEDYEPKNTYEQEYQDWFWN